MGEFIQSAGFHSFVAGCAAFLLVFVSGCSAVGFSVAWSGGRDRVSVERDPAGKVTGSVTADGVTVSGSIDGAGSKGGGL